jgi:hypothetical protein
LLAALLSAAIPAVPVAVAQSTPSSNAAGRKWSIVGDAASDKDLSGAACSSDGRCLLVSDEKRKAWFFKLDELHPAVPKIVIDTPVKLTPRRGGDEADAEAAAFDRDHFFAIGSHGASRRKGEFQASRYFAYRIDKTGTVDPSDALVRIIAATPGLKEHFCDGTRPNCESLQNGGANIEGLAARNGNLYVGFRAPAPGGKAFILRVSEDGLFGRANPDPAVFRIDLGKDGAGRDLGIRDIAAVSDGFLVLAGPSLPEGDENVGSAKVVRWTEGKEQPVPLRDIPVTPKGVKPEVLLVLEDTPAVYRVLILSDGVAGGAPVEYRISKR